MLMLYIVMTGFEMLSTTGTGFSVIQALGLALEKKCSGSLSPAYRVFDDVIWKQNILHFPLLPLSQAP
jgi:hypothetical protein